MLFLFRVCYLVTMKMTDGNCLIVARGEITFVNELVIVPTHVCFQMILVRRLVPTDFAYKFQVSPCVSEYMSF